jgi:DNA-binding transcriptional MerR regulator
MIRKHGYIFLILPCVIIKPGVTPESIESGTISMKTMNQYLTIRKFSELTHTTIDTLKHYDDIGLLKPARIGPNRYRYYLPEQSLELTRILFGKNASIPLKEIKNFIRAENSSDTMEKYCEIGYKLHDNITEIHAILSTIENLKYYYGFSKRHAPMTFFSFYLPEWFIIESKKAKIGHEFEASESNIANQLFMTAFADEKWPHYLLQALFTPDEIKNRDFSKITYFLKIDRPELHAKEHIRFIPNGEWIGMLFYMNGKNIPQCLNDFLNQLEVQHKSIKGPVFVMDVVNCLITSKPEDYCTMIYAMNREQTYEEY